MTNPNIKPVQLDIAESMLLDAADTIRGRLKEHGHTERSFKMVGELWTTYIAHAFTIRGETKLQPHDVANLMSLLKVSRMVYGYSKDNFMDNAGYTALSAMLTPTPKDDKVVPLNEKKMEELFPKVDFTKEA